MGQMLCDVTSLLLTLQIFTAGRPEPGSHSRRWCGLDSRR